MTDRVPLAERDDDMREICFLASRSGGWVGPTAFVDDPADAAVRMDRMDA
jgi:hypothetical protein